MEEVEISFQARIITQHPQDKLRVFLITYYLDSKEMSIQEGRSQACSTPKSYFSKGKITSRSTRAPFEPSDFYVGATIHALGRKFYLTDASKATLDYMEVECDDFPKSDLNNAVDSLKSVKNQILGQFNRADARGRGYISSDAAQDILDAYRIVPQYVITIMRRFDENGKFDYQTLEKYL